MSSATCNRTLLPPRSCDRRLCSERAVPTTSSEQWATAAARCTAPWRRATFPNCARSCRRRSSQRLRAATE
eukprot:358822-Chlamydomonas_euryale.AAC.3